MSKYTIGIDFGKTGCRALLLDISNGSEIASASAEYYNGIMLNNFFNGVPLPEKWAIADPQDYIDVINESVSIVSAKVPAEDIVGIGLAFSSCCILPVKADGTPLSALPEFKNNPHAYIKVTRHRSAEKQANKIYDTAKAFKEPWLDIGQNGNSPEWLLPKVLEILEESPAIYEAADYFIEATDWLIWQLTGNPVRNAFSASFKAQVSEDIIPSKEFLKALHPALENLYQTKLNLPIASTVTRAGGLTRAMAAPMGIKAGTPVAVGGVDILCCLPALNVCKPGILTGILGTSSIFVTLSQKSVEPMGIARGVKGSIIPGYYTYKSNLPCVGDNYAWFLNNYLTPEYHNGAKAEGRNLHSFIAQKMMKLKPGENGIISLNWLKGTVCPINDKNLSGLFIGMDLNTKPEHIYRAIIEGMAFDTRMLIEEYAVNNIDIESFYGIGTIAERNPFITQLYADILNMPVYVAGSSKSPALGAGIIAATISGQYPDIQSAAAAMGQLKNVVYMPDVSASAVYDSMYVEYKKLRDYFAVENTSIMHNLKAIKRENS